MASTTSKPVKLQQLLQQQQEPFMLEVYLVERGHLRKAGLSSESGCFFHSNGRKIAKRSASSSLKQSRSNCPRIIKATYNWVISINEKLRTRIPDQRDEKSNVPKGVGRNQEGAGFDKFSSASSTTVFNSCSESNVDETTTSLRRAHEFRVKTTESFQLCTPTERETWLSYPRSKQAISHRRFKWREIEETKPLSPVSVLEGIPGHGGSPLHKAFQQTKQLLFDCLREMIKNQVRKQKPQEHFKECLGPEELRRIIDEKTKSCWKVFGDSLNLKKLLDLDLMHSTQEWSRYEPQQKDIAMEIGDSIFEEIKSATIVEIIHLLSSIDRN
ncbi:hypothetical protein K2173_007902 [Erythroxylum novogranatense]|uniref:DUF4378 domain-containing protein n=1 Tax=Erythroxylum novogranatense TaxID=1862640 RepID=A0AAV8T788_9ROSI|nr:hypothetical protein K2173_007902 [Erythroxylum novogranatense]